jgi:hypothetical protein
MLFDEVAIEPKCIFQIGFDIYLRTLFGLDKGRVISQLPRDWVNEIRSELKKITDESLKIKISTLISSQSFINALYDGKRRWNTCQENDWLKNVEFCHNQKNLSAILNTSRNDTSVFFDLDNIDSYHSQSEKRVGHFELNGLNKLEIISEIEPFLAKNKCITLVNYSQTLLTNEKSSTLFKLLFDRWKSLGGISFKVIRSSRDRGRGKSGLEILEEEKPLLRKYLKDSGYSGSFQFIAVDDTVRENRLHDRYMIGSISGLELGIGLEMENQPWKIMLHSTYEKQKRRFMDKDIRDEFKKSFSYIYPER